jgi:catechol 2,3-dioxygenase-like lactoylglutathione lyase family enzyme
LEFYVSDLEQSTAFWRWFLEFLGYRPHQKWPSGHSWILGSGTYLVLVQADQHSHTSTNHRQRPGLNHLAFQGGSASELSLLRTQLQERRIPILAADDDHICFEAPDGVAVEVFSSDENTDPFNMRDTI